jgi:hypothetical protein
MSKSVLCEFAICLLFSLSVTPAEGKKHLPAAPLPGAILNAKKIFVSNGGGSNLAFDAFYSALKLWGKYTFVGSPDEADLIVELAYRVDYGGTQVWSASNGRVHSEQLVDPQLVLTIYDAKTKTSLWSEVDHRRLARSEKNREKEMMNSADRLVEDLRIRSSLTK